MSVPYPPGVNRRLLERLSCVAPLSRQIQTIGAGILDVTARPKRICQFELLMYLSVAISAGSYGLLLWPTSASWIFLSAVWWGLTVWLSCLTKWRSRDWARRLLLIWLCLDLFKFVLMKSLFEPIPSLIYAVALGVQAVACYLVFTGESRAYFSGTTLF